jgi:alpha,alpha-trehalase
MIKLLLLLAFCVGTIQASTQTTPTPDKLWGDLFKEVQLKRVFADNKTFVDCTPKFEPSYIMEQYAQEKTKASFDLKAFIERHFSVPVMPNVKVTQGLSLIKHLEELWGTLSREKDTMQQWSSLLPLPYPYIVPGGRFREIYYWDSYFTMQGLAVSNRYDLIEGMVNNFRALIETYGHIPNGNRNYYLSRSQPPYFALMVALLSEKKGDSTYASYFPSMEKEYQFWMDGTDNLKNIKAYRRVVKMPDGSILNRHWDDNNLPRQEAYAEDVATGKAYKNNDELAYVNLRASAESGWDFCSRWFEDTMNITSIETTNIVPVDLNALLYAYENILSKAATISGQLTKASYYKGNAQKRKAALVKYTWDRERKYFFDYDFKQGHHTRKISIAGVMPLFCDLATADQAALAKTTFEKHLLKDGGAVSTTYHTGEQWDAPNGWAPLQFIAVKGFLNYGHNNLARTIAERWMAVNEKVFAATGKMLEKYNVENISLESGGGEYPTQDGFGWTNGVYLKFHQLFKATSPISSKDK